MSPLYFWSSCHTKYDLFHFVNSFVFNVTGLRTCEKWGNSGRASDNEDKALEERELTPYETAFGKPSWDAKIPAWLNCHYSSRFVLRPEKLAVSFVLFFGLEIVNWSITPVLFRQKTFIEALTTMIQKRCRGIMKKDSTLHESILTQFLRSEMFRKACKRNLKWIAFSRVISIHDNSFLAVEWKKSKVFQRFVYKLHLAAYCVSLIS